MLCVDILPTYKITSSWSWPGAQSWPITAFVLSTDEITWLLILTNDNVQLPRDTYYAVCASRNVNIIKSIIFPFRITFKYAHHYGVISPPKFMFFIQHPSFKFDIWVFHLTSELWIRHLSFSFDIRVMNSKSNFFICHASFKFDI